MTPRTEMQARRGAFLTVMALLLALAAVVDLIKALTTPPPPGQNPMGVKMPPTGMVVFGTRHTGSSETILGLLVAAFLLFYVFGIWRMKRYAMTLGWIYAAYVFLNIILFRIRNPPPPTPSMRLFAIVYLIGAIVIPTGTAIALTRRRAYRGLIT